MLPPYTARGIELACGRGVPATDVWTATGVGEAWGGVLATSQAVVKTAP
jgi:hypothetical protein